MHIWVELQWELASKGLKNLFLESDINTLTHRNTKEHALQSWILYVKFKYYHTSVSKCYCVYQENIGLLFIGEMTQETNCPIATIDTLYRWDLWWRDYRFAVCLHCYSNSFNLGHESIKGSNEIYIS